MLLSYSHQAELGMANVCREQRVIWSQSTFLIGREEEMEVMGTLFQRAHSGMGLNLHMSTHTKVHAPALSSTVA